MPNWEEKRGEMNRCEKGGTAKLQRKNEVVPK